MKYTVPEIPLVNNPRNDLPECIWPIGGQPAMMEHFRGYWISGSTVPGPPNTRYWESLGIILKDGRKGSVVEIGRIQDNGITFDFAAMAVWYGMEISRMLVDHCLSSPG